MRTTILACLVLAACASTASRHSGFLDDYSILEPSAHTEGAMVWGVDSLGAYDRFIIEPVVFYVHPDAQGKPIDSEELDDLAVHFRSEFIRVLSERYLVVTEPGPGVLRVKLAITDLFRTKGASSVPATPATGIGLAGASIEAKGLDSVSGALVVAAVDSRGGDRVEPEGAPGKWGHARRLATLWAERMRDRLDELHDRQ